MKKDEAVALWKQVEDDAVMVCRSGCEEFGDGNKPLDENHCWACGISYRMRRIAALLHPEPFTRALAVKDLNNDASREAIAERLIGCAPVLVSDGVSDFEKSVARMTERHRKSLEKLSEETPTLEQQDRLQRAWHRLHVVTLRGGEDHTAYVDDYEAAKAEVLAAALALHEQERRWQPIHPSRCKSLSRDRAASEPVTATGAIYETRNY